MLLFPCSLWGWINSIQRLDSYSICEPQRPKTGLMQMQALSTSSSPSPLPSFRGLVSSSSTVGIPFSVRFRTNLSSYYIIPPPTRWRNNLPFHPMASINSTNTGAATAAATVAAPKWAQKTITIPAQKRGCHLITSKVFFFFFLFSARNLFLLKNHLQNA